MMSAGTKGHQSHSAEKLKQLYQITEDSRDGESEWIPFFCVEARIDFNDVRTGFREKIVVS